MLAEDLRQLPATTLCSSQPPVTLVLAGTDDSGLGGTHAPTHPHTHAHAHPPTHTHTGLKSAREMAQHLRELVALAEDLGSVSRTYTAACNYL